MASCFSTNGRIFIDYSLKDGRVRLFKLWDEVLFDEDNGIEIIGWEMKLMNIILAQDWHIDDGHGLRAFVYPILEKFSMKPCKIKE